MSIPRSRIKPNGKVDIWDLGPQRPTAPKAPESPDLDKLKGADRALADVEHEDAVEKYKDHLRHYGAAKREHTAWHDKNGGPIKVELWAVDAKHAIEVEPERYKLDLPPKTKPGPAQIEAERRAAQEAEDLDRARSSDPQFGRVATGEAA